MFGRLICGNILQIKQTYLYSVIARLHNDRRSCTCKGSKKPGPN